MAEIVHITAQIRCDDPPEWAVLQRRLFEDIEAALDIYLAKYTRPDGTLIYAETWSQGRDGLDDLYEAFYNIPLLYLLGGASRLLNLAHFHWEAVNRQAAEYGLVKDEYELGFDQFHQSEGNLYFCHLCAADPENPKLQDRARRFADLYMGLPNYDPELNIIRAVHTGAGGPRWGYLEGHDIFDRFMEHFGLAYHDIEGIARFEDVASWNEGPTYAANRARMIDAMETRMGRGESICNVLATCIVTNAYVMTGDTAYRDWVARYTQGWWDRTEDNNGIIPDNVGLDGNVGTEMGGNWYGAAYGWSWPLGYDYICDFLDVAAANATLVTGQTEWFEMPGQLFDQIFARSAVTSDFRADSPPRPDRWIVEATQAVGNPSALVAPKKHSSRGWTARYPFLAGPVVGSWVTTFDDLDQDRVAALRAAEPQNWSQTFTFRGKGDDGHERPWFAYQTGAYDSYPGDMLRSALEIVAERRKAVEYDWADLTQVHIHHWQNNNPVTTEALVQLTLGGPQQRYNGGPFRTCFRYFDAQENRAGLPQGVSALVSEIDRDGAVLTFVNLHQHTRDVLVQGGFYGEHHITQIQDQSGDDVLTVEATAFHTTLPAQSTISIRVDLKRNANQPQFSWPVST